MIHGKEPAFRNQLVIGKQGKPVQHDTPVDMPALAKKYTRDLDWEGKVVQSCVHCHQIGDAMRTEFRDQKETIPDNLIYPFPAPEAIGLTFESDGSFVIKSVLEDSPAYHAGLQSGDEILTVNNGSGSSWANRQILISHADLSWILHNAGDEITFLVQEGGPRRLIHETPTIKLPENWRRNSDISRRVGTWPMRAMALGGLLLEDLSDEARAEQNPNNSQMALFAKHVGQYNEHAAAKKAGYLKDDVIIEFDGITGRTSESELIGHLLAKYQPGDQVKTVVLRDGKRIEMTLPMQ